MKYNNLPFQIWVNKNWVLKNVIIVWSLQFLVAISIRMYVNDIINQNWKIIKNARHIEAMDKIWRYWHIYGIHMKVVKRIKERKELYE